MKAVYHLAKTLRECETRIVGSWDRESWIVGSWDRGSLFSMTPQNIDLVSERKSGLVKFSVFDYGKFDFEYMSYVLT